ncbi:MAG: imidazole glycerol phosphate synthase subunit HisF [Candidatus Latescibacterota bacterium]|jgi:cyclase|tara:strand:- start:271 stop:1044 length:774 start_codon:yes stop_codon:yes gene_type:complete
MLAKRIIPCLDVKNGRNVRGVRFSADRDAGDPVELAARYDREGADELVFYDITASADGRAIVMDLVRQVSEQVFIPLTVGGGIRTFEDVRTILKNGADKVSINSAHVHTPDIINQSAESFGAQCIVGAIDVQRRPAAPGEKTSWEIYINGGRTATGIDALEWVEELVSRGAGELVLNSIDADGTKAGYDLELNREVAHRVRVPIVASGGAGSMEHIHEVLTTGEASAALAASIFHFEQHSIPEVKEFLAERGVVVRL